MAEPELWGVIDQIGTCQLELTLAGFAARGGASFGEMHVSPEMCFGKAMIEAVLLETEASTPRIVLSDDLQSLVRHHLTFYSGPGVRAFPYHEGVLVDEDGRYFINYLTETGWNEFGSDLDMLETHATVIREALDTHADDDHVRAKYEWMAAYHNFFLDHCLDFSEECPPDSHRIDELRIRVGTSYTIRRLKPDDALRIELPPDEDRAN